jgi:hypothetical protein
VLPWFSERGLGFVRRDEESSLPRPRRSLLLELTLPSRLPRSLSLSLFPDALSLLRLWLSLFEPLLPLLGGLGGGSLRGAGAGSLLGLSVRGLSVRGLSGFRSSCARTLAGTQSASTNITDAFETTFAVWNFISASLDGTRLFVFSGEPNPDECRNYTRLRIARKVFKSAP